MIQATNIPFRKKLDELGLPIKFENVINNGSNRKSRRSLLNKQRAFNNSRNFQQIVSVTMRFLKRSQIISATNGIKRIDHLDLV